MLRVSATLLDSFRLFLDPANEWMTEERLAADILRTSPATPKMALGSAFGAVLEAPDRYRVDGGYRHGAHFFPEASMAPALAMFDRRGLFEVPATKTYGDVVVSCRVDQLLGSLVIENKTTLDAFDYEKYRAAWQWRLYADVYQAVAVEYRVFELVEDGPACASFAEQIALAEYEAYHAENGIPVAVEDRPAVTCYRLREDGIRDFREYPYPGLHEDCASFVDLFRAYVVGRGLDEPLRARQAQVEAA